MLRIHRWSKLNLLNLILLLGFKSIAAQDSDNHIPFKQLMSNMIGQCVFSNTGDSSYLFSSLNTGQCNQKDTNNVFVFYSKISDSLYIGNVINLYDTTRSRDYQKTGCSSFFAFPIDSIVTFCPVSFNGQRKYRNEKEGATFFDNMYMYNYNKELVRSVSAFYLNTNLGISISFSCYKKHDGKYKAKSYSYQFSEIMAHKKLLTSDRDLLEIVLYAKNIATENDKPWKEVDLNYKLNYNWLIPFTRR